MTVRYDGLWDHLTSFGNLLNAFHKARRGKRHLPEPAAFEFHLENELCRLQRELRARMWRPGPGHTFQILEPKPRTITAAPFRDRVVHHALVNVLEPIWESRFIHDSYACRKGKGVHAAVDRFQQFARRHRYVLKCDVRKYFPSIDREILKELLRWKIADEGVLWLADGIIDHGEPPEPLEPDDLWLAGRVRGLPLGNQTSQFFANVYLDPFDRAVKEGLRARCYLRYVDDFVLFGDDTHWLGAAREWCREALTTLRLRLHPNKAVISRVEDGTRFLGYRVFPTHRLLPRDNVVSLQRRLRHWRRALATGRLSGADVERRLAGWMGHALQANTHRLREWVFLEPSANR